VAWRDGSRRAFCCALTASQRSWSTIRSSGHVAYQPVAFGIRPGDAFAGARILHETLPVPDQPADIELVVEQAGAAARVAVDGRGGPGLARWAGDTRLVQGARDKPGRGAVGIGAEDALHDRRFCRLDRAAAAHGQAVAVGLAHDRVAVAQPAAGAALLDAAAQAPMRLGGKILEEERVHRALEADMELADLAFGQRNQLHAGKGELLVENGAATGAFNYLFNHAASATNKSCACGGANDAAKAIQNWIDGIIDDIKYVFRSDSRILGRNLEAAGFSRFRGEEAHHIVAQGDLRAAVSREILNSVGMDINDANNGMFLESSRHHHIHMTTYHGAVTATLLGAQTYADVAARLTLIRGSICAGTFPR
jgi:hypothetical protein